MLTKTPLSHNSLSNTMGFKYLSIMQIYQVLYGPDHGGMVPQFTTVNDVDLVVAVVVVGAIKPVDSQLVAILYITSLSESGRKVTPDLLVCR